MSDCFLIGVLKLMNSNGDQQVDVDWLYLFYHICMNPEQTDFSVIWLQSMDQKDTEITASQCKITSQQLLKCLFPEWSMDRSGLSCADTYFHDLPGSPTPSVTLPHASSFFVLSGVNVLSYSSGCLLKNTISVHYPLLHCSVSRHQWC